MINVTPATIDKLALSYPNRKAQQAKIFTVQVTAWDQYGNRAPGNVTLIAGPNADPLSTFPLQGLSH